MDKPIHGRVRSNYVSVTWQLFKPHTPSEQSQDYDGALRDLHAVSSQLAQHVFALISAVAIVAGGLAGAIASRDVNSGWKIVLALAGLGLSVGCCALAAANLTPRFAWAVPDNDRAQLVADELSDVRQKAGLVRVAMVTLLIGALGTVLAAADALAG